MERKPQAGDDVVQAASRLIAEPSTPIAELAKAFGWSDRHFIHRFRVATGHTPRRFARIARFEQFTRLLQQAPNTSMAELALIAGYFDQPHLHRDVTAFASTTPGELRRRVIPGKGGFVDS